MNCPCCDDKLEYEAAEPDMGIMSSGFYCHTCDKLFDEEGDER